MIVLSDKIRITGQYQGKSKFAFWKELKNGDIVTIALQLKGLGHYKPELILTNENTGETFRESLNKIDNYLDKVGHEEFIPRRQNDYEQMIAHRKPLTTLEDKLIYWLVEDGYGFEESTNDIRNATIEKDGSKVTITYSNGVVDVVEVWGNNVKEIV